MKVCYYLCDQAKTRKSRGIGVYTNELIYTLVAQKQLEMCSLTSLDGPQIAGVDSVVLPFKTSSIPMRLLVDHLHPFALPDADIYHYPKGFMPFWSKRSKPQIASVLDTIGVHYYDNYKGKIPSFKPYELEYWLAVLTRTLKQADAVITISHKSAESIRLYCDRCAIVPPSIFVTHLASKYGASFVSAMVPVKRDYVVHFASDLPHKRTSWLLDVWRQGQKGNKCLPELKLVGRLSSALRSVAESINGVQLLPYLDDEQLQNTISEARALIYPSEIEGFGLPALEAYQLGTPVLYVADTSVDEIMRVDGHNLPGRFCLDYDDFWRAFDEVMNVGTDILASIRKKMLCLYSWDITAKQTFYVYDKVVNGFT